MNTLIALRQKIRVPAGASARTIDEMESSIEFGAACRQWPTGLEVHVTRTISVAPPVTGFEEFLYSRIGQHDTVVQLSVLSIIARYDIDPWEEADRLSRLPESVAIEELCSLLGALPHDCTAARLIALLPHPCDRRPSLRRMLAALVLKRPAALLVAGILFFLICITAMVSGW